MKIRIIVENYMGLPDEDEFEAQQECSICRDGVVHGHFATCHCAEVYCFDCIEKRISDGPPHIARKRPHIDPRLVWRFNRIKDHHGNVKVDHEHLWQCEYCYTPPFYEQMAESYEGLPDEDEFEGEDEPYCWYCNTECNDPYYCDCGASYCERCTLKIVAIEFTDEPDGDGCTITRCPCCAGPDQR